MRFCILNVLYKSEISVFFKLVYTSTFVVIYSDLGFFFFRIKNIKILSTISGIYLIAYKSTFGGSLVTLFRSFVLNCCLGCYSYFLLSGIGFRVICENSAVFLRLGYSNLICLNIPVGICFVYKDKMQFCLYSINYNLLMKFCSYLRLLRHNNVYKQRGLYFKNEILNFKILRNKKIFF